MARYAYVNGRYVPHGDAAVHIEDRGYQFADGVYEVVTVLNGRMVDEAGHMARLERSLRELRIAMPTSAQIIAMIARELVAKNGLKDGLVYMQVTRGVAPRNHAFPKNVAPALVMTTKRIKFVGQKKFTEGVPVISVPDIRWGRRDIKTTSLLPNCLAKQAAEEAGAYEAWLVEDGFVTEGSSSNAWIITKDNVLVTRAPAHEILNGITRQTILKLAAEEGIKFEERPFSMEEAYNAKEAFVSSATSFVTPVVSIDGKPVGNGGVGTLASKLLDAYRDYAAGLRGEAA